MRLSPLLLCAVVACAPESGPTPQPRPDPTSPAGGVPTGVPGGTPTTTAGTPTGTTTLPADCGNLPAGPRPWSTIGLATEEDFDFDADGYALVQSGGSVIGRDQFGDIKIVSATASWDASGIQVMYSGHVIVGAQDEGALKRVDPITGGDEVVVGSLTQPNGVEIGSDDRVYVSEFTTNGRVSWHDLATGDQGVVIANTFMPNGIVLSPDEQILYVGGSAPNGEPAILAVDRIDQDTWDSANVRVVWQHAGGDFDGVEVDVCGNIYTVEYTTGKVMRISPDGLNVEILADLDDPNPWWVEFNALRWGNGVGGWDPMVLYVTDRNMLFPVEIGVPGKPSPSSVWVNNGTWP